MTWGEPQPSPLPTCDCRTATEPRGPGVPLTGGFHNHDLVLVEAKAVTDALKHGQEPLTHGGVPDCGEIQDSRAVAGWAMGSGAIGGPRRKGVPGLGVLGVGHHG